MIAFWGFEKFDTYESKNEITHIRTIKETHIIIPMDTRKKL